MQTLSARHRVAAPLGFAAYGACALIAQLIILQELLIVFAGHELFLGFSLAFWMGWVGAGSWLAGRRSHTNLHRLVVLFIPLLLANVLAIRLSKLLFGFGMLVGLLPMLLLTVILLAPIGLAVGACFTWSCAWAAQRRSLSIGAAYGWETLGAAMGGLLFTAGIAGRLSTDGVILLLSLPAAAITCLLVPRRPLAAASAAITVLLAAGWTVSPMPSLTRAAQWRGYHLQAERVSRYGHLVLAQTGSLTNFFDNGLLAAHFPDPPAYEGLAHWPLLAHPKPERILVIGGAATGTLTELLKHPVHHIEFIELDPAVLELLEPALSPDDRASLHDPRIRIIHQDGRRWLDQSDQTYDIIVLQLPQPRNAQINRLYTLEAFQAAGRRLRPGGLVAFSIPSSENYLSPETAYFNACLYRTLKAAFAHVELIAGDPLLLMGSHEPITLAPPDLLARYAQRRLVTREVVPSYMPFKLDPARRAALLATLDAAHTVPLNRDFFPVCYAYVWRVWLAQFVSPFYFLCALMLLALLAWMLWLAWKHRAGIAQHPQVMALSCLGAAGLIDETLLVLAFQAINGYVYWQLGALFAAFMLGLAIGSGLAARMVQPSDPSWPSRALRGLLAIVGLENIAAIAILPAFRQLSAPAPRLLLFSAALLFTALWVGMAFPLAAQLGPSESVARKAGSLYAADLWGAALGATVTSIICVPLLGLTATAGLTGAVMLAAALFLPQAPHAD
jgi:spermidine synthase